MGRWIVLFLWGWAGCGAALPRCPKEGGAVWTELRTDHFILATDLRAGEAQEILRTLENVRAALFDAIAPSKTGMNVGRIPVVVLRDAGEFETFFSGKVAGIFFPDVLYRPLIVMRPSGAWSYSVGIDEIIKHELTHYLSRFVVPHQSLWLAEGLATYFQTIEVDRDKGEYMVGKASAIHARAAARRPLLSVAAVIDETVDSRDPMFEPTAWAIVHYLLNREPNRFVRYQDFVIRGVPHERAWNAAFAGLPLSVLDSKVSTYLSGGHYYHGDSAVPASRGEGREAGPLRCRRSCPSRAALCRRTSLVLPGLLHQGSGIVREDRSRA